MIYKVIETTADFGIVAQGETLAEAFEWAAFGMFDQMAELDLVVAKSFVTLELTAPDPPALLVAWLSELLYIYEVKEFLPKIFKIEKLEDDYLKARVRGENLDLNRHRIRTHIKAVTYHNLAVEHTDEGWKVQVLFDV